MSVRLPTALLIAFACMGCATDDSTLRPDLAAQGFTASGWAEQCEKWDDWDKPGPPFRIHGNSYYVGTCGIAAVLVTGKDGHVLIDGGTAKGATLVARNIRRLGFDPHDVAIILASHEHLDHVGGIAALQAETGARVIANPAAKAVLESGRVAKHDPQYGAIDGFAPVRVGAVLTDNRRVVLGDIAILALATPGHTEGATSYQWASVENGEWRAINYIDSLSPISAEDYRFSDHPDRIAAYRVGLERLRHVGCGILVTPHPSASKLHERIARGMLDDPTQCRRYADAIAERLDRRLAREAAEAP